MTLPPNPFLNYLNPGEGAPFHNWKSGSVALGIIAIVGGAMGSCLGIFFPFMLLVPMPQKLPLGQVIMTSALYLAMGGGLIWLGIGAIRLRRWVRPLMLIFGVLALLTGALSALSIAFVLPTINTAIAAAGGPKNPAPPPGMVAFTMTFTIGFMLIFAVILPGIYVWFYAKQIVREMLEFHDPNPRWTDLRPVPALALPVILVMIGFTQLLSLGAGNGLSTSVTFFGTLLSGPLGLIVKIITALIALALVRPTYQLRYGGWCGVMILQALWCASALITSLNPNLIHLYESSGLNDEQLKILRSMPGFRLLAVAATTLMFTISTIYLLKVRKYFTGPPLAEPVPLNPPIE